MTRLIPQIAIYAFIIAGEQFARQIATMRDLVAKEGRDPSGRPKVGAPA